MAPDAGRPGNLLRDRRFWPIFWTQFLGAFNDNAFKNALVILITFKAYSLGKFSTEQMVALCGGIFILPFFLFSATAGQLADKLSKSRLVVGVKIWEILVMLLGAYGFVAEHFSLLLVTLFLMGLHSAFFGPVKYSILPQLLRSDELVSGNGYVEMGTFIAILLGTILGGVLIAIPGPGPWLMGLAVLTIAGFGFLTSLQVMPLAPVLPDLEFQVNPIPPTLRSLSLTRKVKSVFWSVVGISWFWFLGASFLALLPPYCKDFLAAKESVITFFLALFSVGVGAGSLLCSRLSFRKLEPGLVLPGALGLSLFAFDLFLVGHPASLAVRSGARVSIAELLSALQGWRIVLDMFFFSVSGGFFIVPLYTLIQQRSEPTERSRIIAGNNILNALFMVVSSLLLVALFAFKFTIPEIFLVLCALNLCMALLMAARFPELPFRALCWIVSHLAYRSRVTGGEHLPAQGAAVLICNHVLGRDWMVVAGACDRPVRFVLNRSFLSGPLVRFLQARGTILVWGSTSGTELQDPVIKRVVQALESGELVCFLQEDAPSAEGGALKGLERWMESRAVPVVPMAFSHPAETVSTRDCNRASEEAFSRLRPRLLLCIREAVSPGALLK